MTKSDYAIYLASPHWKQLRGDTILDRDGTCERCGMPRWLASIAYDQDLHVHHKSYARLGSEEPEDLEVLCRRCHELETFGRSDLRERKSSCCRICTAVHWDPYADYCSLCATLCGARGNIGNALMQPDPEHDYRPLLDYVFGYIAVEICRTSEEAKSMHQKLMEAVA